MGLLSLVSQFKHKAEIRESKDEILIGEIIFLLAQNGWPTVGFRADAGLQTIRFRTLGDEVLYGLQVRLNRLTGSGAVSSKLVGNKSTLRLIAEVKNMMADPDDLLNQWSTDLKNIAKIPLAGQVKLNHELNSVFAEKAKMIEIDNYVLAGQEGRDRLKTLLDETVAELRGHLTQYKKTDVVE